MSDLVEQLRKLVDGEGYSVLMAETADEIEWLRGMLQNEWEHNHASHCDHDHEKTNHECYWPHPDTYR